MISSHAAARHRLLSVVVTTALALTASVVATRPPSADAAPRPVHPHLREVGLTPLAPGEVREANSQPVAPEPGAPAVPRPTRRYTPVSGAQTGALDTGGRLHVVGVTWPDGALSDGDSVEYRVLDDGHWGDWTAMAVDGDHGPDPDSAEGRRARAGTDPYVVTGDSVEARVLATTTKTVPSAVQLDVVDPSVSPADGSAGSTAHGPGAATAGGVKPSIRTRADWGADESLRSGTPSYGTIKAGFVHHTVNANGYSAAQVPSIIRGIYAFHTQSRGWSDIGYNFLVDRFGTIWEGRAGGVTQPVIGAHTGGYNSQLFGAAALGTFSTAAPPSAMLSSFNSLFAWKLGLAHVDPAATVTLSGMSRAISTVSGHRDADGAANDTECPGNALYAKLPGIRTAAKSLQGAMFYTPRLSKSWWAYGGAGPTITAPANSDLTWKLTVTSPCHSGALATVSGSSTGAAGVSATWNGRIGSSWAPPGSYTLTLSASRGSGTLSTVPPWTTSVTIGATDGAPRGYCPPRLGGADRYATAVAVARSTDPSSQTVVVANGTESGIADALVAAPLAAATGGVLLLTNGTSLSTTTAADITRRGATSAYLVGGTGAISSSVDKQLRGLGVTTVTRYGGQDRYDTAARVATAVAAPSGGTAPDVLVASGIGSMADGLVLAGPASALRRPVLLVNDRSVPAPTRTALTALGVQRTVVAGGAGVAPDAVLRALPRATRVGGADRYDTAARLGSWARGVMPVTSVLIAAGDTTPLVDTLSGGQLARVILYVRNSSVPSQTANWLAGAALSDLTVLGGPASVPDVVAGRAQVAAGLSR